MALPATDTFTGTTGTQLTTYSANWTLCLGDFDIQSNALSADASGNNGAGWNADAFNDDQYAEATFAAVFQFVYLGVAVRCDVGTPDDTFYLFYSDSTDGSYLEKIVNGAETQLGNKGATFAVNDVIRIEASGTTITPIKNGGTLNPPNAQTDASISSGAAGVSGYDDSAFIRIDNWEGGNLGGGGVIGQIAGVAWASVGQLATVAEASISQVAGVVAN